MHISHIPLDKAILLHAMIEKRRVDVGWIVFNNMVDSVKPSKSFSFPPALITQLCIDTSIEVTRNEEKVKEE